MTNVNKKYFLNPLFVGFAITSTSLLLDSLIKIHGFFLFSFLLIIEFFTLIILLRKKSSMIFNKSWLFVFLFLFFIFLADTFDVFRNFILRLELTSAATIITTAVP
jgi:hypothetical protein